MAGCNLVTIVILVLQIAIGDPSGRMFSQPNQFVIFPADFGNYESGLC